ncbi:transcriptional regulator [Methylobacterium sp. NFXW15]|uniref:transcriptional regulator n=1 Tax=Methylobacterium sp. NFXW15 TaxID=2819512 RepID=UPI003CF3376B
MFADHLRRAIAAAPRAALADVARGLWAAVANGQVSEEEAEILSAEIDARRIVPAAPATRRGGSRPRSPSSLERRRRWAASGGMPVGLAARFSLAEQAALAVVAAEVAVKGDCRLCIGAVAGRAGVSETSVRNAIREARRLGLVHVEERRLDRWRSNTNVVTITSQEWRAWIARGGRGGACKSVQPPISRSLSVNRETSENRLKGFRDGGKGNRHRQDGPPIARTGSGRLFPSPAGR